MAQISRPTLSRAQAESLVRAWIDAQKEALEYNFAESGTAFFTPEEASVMGDQAPEIDALMKFAAVDAGFPALKDAARHAFIHGETADSDLGSIVESALGDLAPHLDRTSATGRFLVRTILRGVATLLDEQVDILRGDLTPIPAAKDLPPLPTAASTEAFLASWDEFRRYKVTEGQWDEATAANAASSKTLFEGLVESATSLPPSRIDARVVSAFRAALFWMPRFYDKNAQFRGLPLPERIAKADAIDGDLDEKTPKVARLKAKTIDKHFCNLAEFWRWQQKCGRIAKTLACPFDGFARPKKSLRASRGDRLAWPLPLQQALFTSPVWSGCVSIHRRAKPGVEIHRDALFWTPLIARAVGLREDEACSMLVGHVRLQTGIEYPPGESGPSEIWYFAIEDSKTLSSTRDVPVPTLLLEMGFLEFRVIGRDLTDPLFPELLPQGVGQSRGVSLGKRFTEYRKRIRVYQERIDFHSLRATLATDLGNLPGLNSGWADEITGHDSPIRRSVRTLYTKGVLLRNLRDTLDRVRFPGDERLPRYQGARGVQAPGAAADIRQYVALAERETRKKAGRARAGANALEARR